MIDTTPRDPGHCELQPILPFLTWKSVLTGSPRRELKMFFDNHKTALRSALTSGTAKRQRLETHGQKPSQPDAWSQKGSLSLAFRGFYL
jgi:hypothetical protein